MEGATTRARALTQEEKDKGNMADISQCDNTMINNACNAQDNQSTLMSTPIRDKQEKSDRSEKKSNSQKSDKDKAKMMKAKNTRSRLTKIGANANQTGMEEYLHPKGFVAGMVDQINSTPPNSPPHSNDKSTTKKKMLSIKNGQLSIEEDDTDECFQNDVNPHGGEISHHNSQDLTDTDEENEDLTTILKQLNSSVKKLERSVRKIGIDNEDTERKVSAMEAVQSQDSVRMRGIIDSLDDQQDKIDMLIGLVQKQDIQIKSLQNRWDAAYAKETKNNIVINGLSQTQGENCFHEVGNFMKNILKVEKPIQLQQAYRMGKGQNKPMLAKLKNPDDRSEIYKKIGNLKQANRGRAKPYFVSDQLPDAWAEKKKYVHFLKQQNRKLPDAQQADTKIEKGVLSLNGMPYKQPIRVLSPRELCTISTERKQKLRELKFTQGSTEVVESSIFVGYAAEVYSPQQVQDFYDALKLKVPDATHIACAFLLPGIDLMTSQGSIDDGEHGAGRTLLNLLIKNRSKNRAIFLTRHYGGKHIGAVRFQLMEQVCEAAIIEINKAISKRSAPLTDDQLRQLNLEIQENAEKQKEQEKKRREHPWHDEEDNENTTEAW